MKTIRVVAAIIIEDGKVFATQRGYGEFKDGWEFPGGKIDVGETPEEALVREIKEELDTLETTHKDVLKDIYITMIKLRKVTETLVTFLLPEFNEAEYDTLKTDELLKLLNALES